MTALTFRSRTFKTTEEYDLAVLLTWCGYDLQFGGYVWKGHWGTYTPWAFVPRLRLFVECHPYGEGHHERRITEFIWAIEDGAVHAPMPAGVSIDYMQRSLRYPPRDPLVRTDWDDDPPASVLEAEETERRQAVHEASSPFLGPDFLRVGICADGCVQLVEDTARFGCGGDNAYLMLCRQCKHYSFVASSGSYACRYCLAWDGDHHVADWHSVAFARWPGQGLLLDAQPFRDVLGISTAWETGEKEGAR